MTAATDRCPPKNKTERIGEAERMLSACHQRGDVIEIRVVSPRPAAGYFIDPHTAALAAIRYDEAHKPTAVYFVVNRLGEGLYDRSPDKITPGLKPVATDADIIRRRVLFLDFDVERKTKTSATNEEVEESGRVMEETCRQLSDRFGWPEPFCTMSGNGFHAYYRVDLPPDEDSTRLVANVLLGAGEIAKTFSRENRPQIKVDRSVHNESRITKLPGTWVRKGPASKDRPHRVARIVASEGATLRLVSVDQLRTVSALAPRAKAKAPANGQPVYRANGSSCPDDERAALLSALAALNPSRCDEHDSWLRAGMALHSFDTSGSMLAEWDKWSRQSAKYEEGESARRWDSFNGDGGVGVGTIFEWAKQDGWQRPHRQRIGNSNGKGSGNGQGGQTASAAPDERPEVVVTTEEHDVNDEAVKALARDDGIFCSAGRLVHIVRDGRNCQGIKRPKNAPRLSDLPQAVLRERLARAARFVKHDESEDGVRTVDAHPPDWTVKAVHARGNYPMIRPLEAVTEFPVLRADGSILDAPGYDATTGLLYEPNGPVPRIPATPSLAAAMASRDLLLDLVRDFPFERAAHRSTWLAALITALARRAFNGPAPLFLFDANAAGSGKTLLAELISLVVNGREIPRMSNPTNNEEARKLVTALAIGGDPLILIDNVAGNLGCAALDAALTGTSWKDRILGRSEIVSMPLSVTWLASGNNVVLGADTSRRVAHCRLDCRDENPEERSGFKYPDLKAHVEAHRSELLAAALTLLRAYFVAGRPTAGLKPWGSFENWSALVRQVIVWCELPDPGDTRQELRSTDSEAARFRAVLDGLAEAAPNGIGLTTAEILKMTETVASLKDAVDELCDAGPGKPATTRTLGNRLKRMRGKVCRGRTLKMGENRTGFAIWSVVSANGKAADSTDSADSILPSATQVRTRTHAHADSTKTESAGSAESASDRQPGDEEDEF